MAKFNSKLVVKYSTVFGFTKKFDETELQVIDKSTWAKILARLNHLARNRKNYTPDQVLKEWFSSENAEYSKAVYEKIKIGYGPLGFGPNDLTLISIWSNLSLYDKVLKSKGNDSTSLKGNTSEKNLFEIYLALNEEFAEGSNKIADELNIKDYTYPIDYLARTTITTLITYNDLAHLSPVELLISHFIKAYYCFMFLEEGKHNDLVALFLKPYGVTSWQEYLKHLLPIMNAAVIQKDDSGLYYFNIENSADPAKTKILFEHLALNQEESYPIKPDFLHARASPLFKTEENRYLIMDPVLTVNRLYNSIFFELLRIAEANSDLNPKYASFFSLYTFDFIEKFLSYSLLNKVYNKTQCYKLSGQEIKKKFSVESEPDYYVRKGNKVFLFEVKGSVVTGIAKQSFSYLKIEKELQSKYLFDEKDKQNKAIRQLVERIITLFEGKAKYDETANARTIRIFPILLVSEIALTTPATNFLLNQWFKADVDKNDLLRYNKHRICDLVIIDLDTLILYSQVFEENNNLLETMILKYYAAVAQKKIRPAKGIEFNEQFITMQMQKSFIPFSDFLRDELKIKAPDIFIEFGKDLLK